jgi:hypothetical protein
LYRAALRRRLSRAEHGDFVPKRLRGGKYGFARRDERRSRGCSSICLNRPSVVQRHDFFKTGGQALPQRYNGETSGSFPDLLTSPRDFGGRSIGSMMSLLCLPWTHR